MLPRSGYIVYTAGSYKDTVAVQQSGQDATITADKTGMSTDAMALSVKMGIGWNLGNSLEACSSSTSASETLWGNPKTTQALIDAVKVAGFKSVRIPCAWSGYIEDQAIYKIKDSWLARVKEVVDYCINDGLYVVLNSHWDGGWRDENPYYATQTAINAKHKAIWQQIAVYFRDYDEHLLFAGTNEVGHSFSTAPTAENIAVQLSFNQVFVDAVRATGGKNTYRNLLAQAYNTNIDYANTYLTMPTDATSSRLMAEVHFYDPWDYCGLEADASWATVKYYWGKEGGYGQYGTLTDWGQEDWVRQEFALMNTKFVSKNIPVVMGEYGPTYKTATAQTSVDASRNYYLNYVTKKALQNGIVPMYWDNGGTGNFGSGLFDRSSGSQAHTSAISAIISAGN
jgi:endoglucanase